MHFNSNVRHTEFPPVTEAASWVADRQFPVDYPLIDVSQAVPGYPTSDAVLQHMAESLVHPPVSKYGHALGLPELRETYAEQLHNNVSTRHIAITAGCNQAFYVAIAALCDNGDNVILPLPWYFNHKMSLDMLGIDTVALPCDSANQMLPNAADVEKLINNRTRAIVLITPNNPTGRVYPQQTIDAFYELCVRREIPLVIDETYSDFRPDPAAAAHSIFDDPDWPKHAIHLYSFSKAYALAGYRVGALVASEELLVQATKILDCVSICAPQISQHAACFGLQRASDWKEEKRQLMYQRADAFQQAITGKEHGYQIAAIGAYFAYLMHPYRQSSRQVAKFLADQANLLSLPGEMFGPGQEQYLRVAFANVDESKMPEIATRLTLHKM